MASANDKLQDHAVRHLVHLTKLQNKQVKTILDFLESEVIPDLMDEIEKRARKIDHYGYDTGKATTKRLKNMESAIAEIVKQGRKGIRKRLEADLVDLAKHEAEHSVDTIKDVLPIEWDAALPGTDTLRSAILTDPMDGSPLNDWLKKLDRDTRDRLNRTIKRGLVEGQSVDDIVKAVRGTKRNGYTDGVLNATRRNAEAIVRSGVIHASTRARHEFAKANDDLIKGEQIVVTLDDRTCSICGPEDGKVYDLSKGPRPAFHPNCRCTTVPVTKSWRDLGIDKGEIDSTTRASMDGQVPTSQTYPQWLKKQSRETVEDALGKSRAKLFLDGQMDVKRFTNQRGKVLSLKELRQKDKEAFEKAGLDDL